MGQEPGIGDRVIGCVIKLIPFEAFIDIEDSDWMGLVKTPEISWQRISHPQDILALGQLVEAEVLALRLENKQVILSIKRCQKAKE